VHYFTGMVKEKSNHAKQLRKVLISWKSFTWLAFGKSQSWNIFWELLQIWQ